VKLADSKRIPLGWQAFALSPADQGGASAVLHFPVTTVVEPTAWLRVTTAIDVREEVVVEATLAHSGALLGDFNILYSHPFQPFQIAIDSSAIEEAMRHGIRLRMTKGTSDIWLYGPDAAHPEYSGLQPHVLMGHRADVDAAFMQNLLSMNSFSPFGWLGGCVQDALWEMSQVGDSQAACALAQQLSAYLDVDKGIVFENTMTEPRDGTFSSIEDFLPFAAIVNLYPDHPAIKNALAYLKSKTNEQGMIVSWDELTTEGCYTVAYPLAAIAVKMRDHVLAQCAVDQLRFRVQHLVEGATIFQRGSLTGHKAFANWGRGVAWYLLGIIKTIALLKNTALVDDAALAPLRAEFKRAVAQVCQWQSTSGVWSSFIDRPDTGVDTSTSAGIAAAIAWGVRCGELDSTYLCKAAATHEALQNYITPDGFLTHVSQINRGGEALQASSYRVMSQFGMGLLAQLACVLRGA